MAEEATLMEVVKGFCALSFGVYGQVRPFLAVLSEKNSKGEPMALGVTVLPLPLGLLESSAHKDILVSFMRAQAEVMDAHEVAFVSEVWMKTAGADGSFAHGSLENDHDFEGVMAVQQRRGLPDVLWMAKIKREGGDAHLEEFKLQEANTSGRFCSILGVPEVN